MSREIYTKYKHNVWISRMIDIPTSGVWVAEKRTVCRFWISYIMVPWKKETLCQCKVKTIDIWNQSWQITIWSYTWGSRLNICFISSSKFCSSIRSASSITRHYKNIRMKYVRGWWSVTRSQWVHVDIQGAKYVSSFPYRKKYLSAIVHLQLTLQFRF
jgi:hypothetical protein